MIDNAGLLMNLNGKMSQERSSSTSAFSFCARSESFAGDSRKSFSCCCQIARCDRRLLASSEVDGFVSAGREIHAVVVPSRPSRRSRFSVALRSKSVAHSQKSFIRSVLSSGRCAHHLHYLLPVRARFHAKTCSRSVFRLFTMRSASAIANA